MTSSGLKKKILFEIFPMQKVFRRLPLRDQKRLVEYRLYFISDDRYHTPYISDKENAYYQIKISCSSYSSARVKDTVLQAHEYLIVSVGLIKCVTLNPICCYNT